METVGIDAREPYRNRTECPSVHESSGRTHSVGHFSHEDLHSIFLIGIHANVFGILDRHVLFGVDQWILLEEIRGEYRFDLLAELLVFDRIDIDARSVTKRSARRPFLSSVRDINTRGCP